MIEAIIIILIIVREHKIKQATELPAQLEKYRSSPYVLRLIVLNYFVYFLFTLGMIVFLEQTQRETISTYITFSLLLIALLGILWRHSKTGYYVLIGASVLMIIKAIVELPLPEDGIFREIIAISFLVYWIMKLYTEMQFRFGKKVTTD